MSPVQVRAPLEFDAPLIEALQSRAVMALRSASAVLLALWAGTSTGQSILGVSRATTAVLTLWYLADVVVVARFAGVIALGRRWRAARAAVVLSLAGLGAAYGALSGNGAGVLWLFMVPTVLPWASIRAHRAPGLLAAGAVLPWVLSKFGPRPDAWGMPVAMGLCWAVALAGWCWFTERRQTAISAARLTVDELVTRRRVLDAWAAPLKLHDAVSGPAFALETHLRRTTDWARIDALVGDFTRATTPWLQRSHASSPVEHLENLRRYAQSCGVPLLLSAGEGLELLEARLAEDVVLIAWEAVATLLRTELDGIHLAVNVGDTRVTVECRSREVALRTNGGRGMRNVRLRAWSRGGRVSVTTLAHERTLTVMLPRHHARAARWLRTAVAIGVTVLCGAVALHPASGLAIGAYLTSIVALVLWVASRLERQNSLQLPRRHMTLAPLAEACVALEAAAVARDRPALLSAARRLNEAVQRTLSFAENEPPVRTDAA